MHDQIGTLFASRSRLASCTVALAFAWIGGMALDAEGETKAGVIACYKPEVAAFATSWLALAKLEDPAVTVACALDGWADDIEAMQIEPGIGAKVRAMVAAEAITPAVKRLIGVAGPIPPRVEPTVEQRHAAQRELVGWVMAAPGLAGLAEALEALCAEYRADGGTGKPPEAYGAWKAVERGTQSACAGGMGPDDLRDLLDMWTDATPGAPRIAVNVIAAPAP